MNKDKNIKNKAQNLNSTSEGRASSILTMVASRRNNLLPIHTSYGIGILLMIGLFIVLSLGIVNIFNLRFSKGDLYPEYSSYRADPIGCKALYDTFNELDIITERNFNPISDIKKGASKEGAIIIQTGIKSLNSIYNDKGILPFIMNGGKFIGFFDPKTKIPSCRKKDKKKKSDKKSDPKEKKEIIKSTSKDINSFKQLLNCELRNENSSTKDKKNKSKKDKSSTSSHNIAKPTKYLKDKNNFIISPTFSENYFKIDDKWCVLFTSNDRAVIIERKIGRGSIILSNSPYFITNEGLKKNRANGLILYMIGSSKRIIFDEFALGVQEKRNIAWLFKKYKLHYLLLNLLIIVLLFLWYNFGALSNIQPSHKNSYIQSNTVESALSATSGLSNIISQNISKKELLNISIEEWRKTIKSRGISKIKIEKIDKIILDSNNNNPVATYKLIRTILLEKKEKI